MPPEDRSLVQTTYRWGLLAGERSTGLVSTARSSPEGRPRDLITDKADWKGKDVPLAKCGRCGKALFARLLAAKNFLATRDLDAVPLRPYYDSGCRAWHLTSQAVSR